jgi:cell division protein FtsL
MKAQKDINLTFTVSFLIVITLFLLIKVYISNKIYLISRDIQKISSKIEALHEEQKILKLKVEKLKYQHSIIDPFYQDYQQTETTNGEQY